MTRQSKILKTIEELDESGLINEHDLSQLQRVAQQFNVAITPTIRDMMDESDRLDPVRAQFIPSTEELNVQPEELSDPIGDKAYEKVRGVIHRYPDRCLIKVVNVCAVNCRFCFRRELMAPVNKSLSEKDLQRAYEYISDQKDIWEVILTGGDPFILKPKKLGQILKSLSNIEHVEVIRIHTRVPLVDPDRVSCDLVAALKVPRAVYVVLHANHPNEFTENGIAACARLVDAGIPMLSQSVLLKGINDDPDTLGKLMRTFVKNRIKPYYLHHPDLVKGTSHFRILVEEGQQLMRFLRGRFSGLCQPTYVLDIPGGAGKVPIGPCYIHRDEDKKEVYKWLVEDFLGRIHYY